MQSDKLLLQAILEPKVTNLVALRAHKGSKAVEPDQENLPFLGKGEPWDGQ